MSDTPTQTDASTPTEPGKPPAPIVETRRHGKRFALIYGTLGVVTALAIVGFVLYEGHFTSLRNSLRTTTWSTWHPQPGTNAKMASEIADHVSHEYHLNKKGTQLVAVVASPPEVTAQTHKILISNIALQSAAKTNKGIQVVSSGSTWIDNLCGLTPSCSIPSGKPTTLRGRLVRREALEVALYTFKFVPAINAVVAFMPPPANSNANTVLYLQRANLTKQLSEPLSKTLPLAQPPLPTTPDPKEAATIDKLTLPAIYKFSYQQLQDASVLLVLNPFKT
jgi:hypothetical protein